MSTQTTHEKAQHQASEWAGVEAYQKGLQAQIAELTAQRDALLEACKTLVNRFGYTAYDITCRSELEQAQRAIAQATGNGQ